MNFAENLKKIRKDYNLSQEQLAERIGVSRQAVSKWESGQSYPEMDKVIQICKMFNYNMDELINGDLNSVNESKEVKGNINKFIDSFFLFITKIVDMFTVMKPKQIICCLFEQAFIATILIIIFAFIAMVGSEVISSILNYFPYGIYYPIYSVLASLFIVAAVIVGAAILFHIFKIRYLDYYEIVRTKEEDVEEVNEVEEKENIDDEKAETDKHEDKKEENKEKNKIILEKRPEKVIIRDPKHTEFSFIRMLGKMVLWCLKFMTFFIVLADAACLVGFAMCLVLSFAIFKTGMLFWGVFLVILGCVIFSIITLEILWNFIVSKSLNKTRVFITLLISIIMFGAGLGLSTLSIKDFEFVEEKVELNKDVYEVDMKDNLIINNNTVINYVEKDIPNIQIEVEHTKYVNPLIREHSYKDVSVDNKEVTYNIVDVSYRQDGEILNYFREILDDFNHKKISNMEYGSNVVVYANKENLEAIKNNSDSHHKYIKYLRERIYELENNNNDLERNNDVLTNYIEAKDGYIIYDKNENVINVIWNDKPEYNE